MKEFVFKNVKNTVIYCILRLACDWMSWWIRNLLLFYLYTYFYFTMFGPLGGVQLAGYWEKNKCMEIFVETHFFFQQRKKLCLFWRLVLLNIKGSSERQSTSYAWDSRGKGQGGTPKTCQSPGWPENTCRPPAPYVNKERLGPQCYSRPSPKYWEKEKGELKVTAQHFISGFVSCTNILFNHYFGSIK